MKAGVVILTIFLTLTSLISCNIRKATLIKTQFELNIRNKVDSLIAILKEDIKLHRDIERCATDEEIKMAETDLGIKLPPSYTQFLKEFGNGAYWLYDADQPINGINRKYGKIHWLGDYRKHLDDEIQSDGFGTFKTRTLLCLMTENSNGGAWCWMTSESDENGEWPLAYYNISDRKLYYKVSDFIEWLDIATKCKGTSNNLLFGDKDRFR